MTNTKITAPDFASLVSAWEDFENSVPRVLGVEDTETFDDAEDDREPDWEAMWEAALERRSLARNWGL